MREIILFFFSICSVKHLIIALQQIWAIRIATTNGMEFNLFKQKHWLTDDHNMR